LGEEPGVRQHGPGSARGSGMSGASALESTGDQRMVAITAREESVLGPVKEGRGRGNVGVYWGTQGRMEDAGQGDQSGRPPRRPEAGMAARESGTRAGVAREWHEERLPGGGRGMDRRSEDSNREESAGEWFGEVSRGESERKDAGSGDACVKKASEVRGGGNWPPVSRDPQTAEQAGAWGWSVWNDWG
jgi:hypothetical protein